MFELAVGEFCEEAKRGLDTIWGMGEVQEWLNGCMIMTNGLAQAFINVRKKNLTTTCQPGGRTYFKMLSTSYCSAFTTNQDLQSIKSSISRLSAFLFSKRITTLGHPPYH